MANVVLKDASGEAQTYEGVESVTLPTSDGGTATFSLKGSEIVQADWAQTDETAEDYIKNKPENLATHEYVQEQIAKIEVVGGESSVTASDLFETLLPKQEFVFTVGTGLGDEQYASYGEEYSNIGDIEIGKTYKVLWDDTEYTLVAGNMQTVGNFIETGFLGNSRIYMRYALGQSDGGIDTGEPFFICAVNGNFQIASNDTANTSHTVRVVEAQIDNQYLSILEREVVETDILPEATISGFTFNATFQAYATGPVIPAAFVLTVGETYIVDWDGETYSCESGTFTYNGDNLVYIGNGAYVGQSGNDEPFLIAYSPAANAHQLFSNVSTDSHTVRIYRYDNGAYKIKEEYMPEGIATEKFVEDKIATIPAGSGGSVLTETDILAEQTLDFTYDESGAAYTATMPGRLPLIADNETYCVVWDDIEYLCVARDESTEYDQRKVLGNDEFPDNTKEPFVFVFDHDKTYLFTRDSAASHKVRVFKTRLNNQYLHAVEGEAEKETDLFPLTTLTGFGLDAQFGYAYTINPAPFALTVGEAYRVRWDGGVYDVVAQDASALVPGAVLIGNGSGLGLDGHNESFGIGIMGGMAIFSEGMNSDASHTIGISQVTTETYKLKEEYLPDTIAPKELILASSTEGSTKRFRITVDDSGTITATEVT